MRREFNVGDQVKAVSVKNNCEHLKNKPGIILEKTGPHQVSSWVFPAKYPKTCFKYRIRYGEQERIIVDGHDGFKLEKIT